MTDLNGINMTGNRTNEGQATWVYVQVQQWSL